MFGQPVFIVRNVNLEIQKRFLTLFRTKVPNQINPSAQPIICKINEFFFSELISFTGGKWKCPAQCPKINSRLHLHIFYPLLLVLLAVKPFAATCLYKASDFS